MNMYTKARIRIIMYKNVVHIIKKLISDFSRFLSIIIILCLSMFGNTFNVKLIILFG